MKDRNKKIKNYINKCFFVLWLISWCVKAYKRFRWECFKIQVHFHCNCKYLNFLVKKKLRKRVFKVYKSKSVEVHGFNSGEISHWICNFYENHPNNNFIQFHLKWKFRNCKPHFKSDHNLRGHTEIQILLSWLL